MEWASRHREQVGAGMRSVLGSMYHGVLFQSPEVP